MAEECPFCGLRVKPIIAGVNIKKCPACGGLWYDAGGGIRKSYVGGGGGESPALII
jgi:Zn-finger nucleic acid-binding protein